MATSNTTKTKVGIFALTLLSMSALGITPSLSLMAQYFIEKGVDPSSIGTQVQLLISIPSLLGIAASFMVARIANNVSKKLLALVGAACVLVGGMLPYLMGDSLLFLQVCSGIVGFGVGVITNVTQLLFTDFLPPEERQTAMAQNTAFVSLGAMAMIAVGGKLAASGSWRDNYLVYISAAVVLLISALCIPSYKGRAAASDDAAAATKDAPKGKLGLGSIVVALLGVLYMMCYNTFNSNIAMYAAEVISDTTTATTVGSLAGTISLAGGLVCGIVLGKLLPHFQKQSFAVAFAMLGVGSIVLAFVASPVLIYVLSFLIGATCSIYMSQAPFTLSVINEPFMIAAAIGTYAVATNIGGFVQPIVINAISGAVLSGTAADALIVAGAIALITSVVLFVTGFQKKELERAFAKKAE